jgi:hypothetical protein
MTILKLSQTDKVNVRLATPDDVELEFFDNTKLTALNTCPTWGIVRYGMHKTPTSAGYREMALEAGSASHEAFAAVRLLDYKEFQDKRNMFEQHGIRLFDEKRFESMLSYLNRDETPRTKRVNFVLEAFNSSGFYDDPRDKRRTATNIEESIIAYIDRWPSGKWPLWEDGEKIGIEVSFELVIEYLFEHRDPLRIRFGGRMDGLHWHEGKTEKRLFIHENKTASRLNESWEQEKLMAHQITGYMIGASMMTQEECNNAMVLGMSIPLPRGYDYGGIVQLPVSRIERQFRDWLDWILHTVQLYQQHKDWPIDAPKYTHSCNRYFRPCSLIPFCASHEDEAQQMLEEMRVDEWSPLDEPE